MFDNTPKVTLKKGIINLDNLLEQTVSKEKFNVTLGANNRIIIKQKEQNQITGKVVDEHGEPLIGVNVLIKNTKTGVSTDLDGSFKINASVGNELVFSYVGFETKTVKIENNEAIVVVLKESSNTLDEVVVTGYYSLPKERATGSFSHIKSDELERITSFSVKDKIEGLVPGLVFEPNFKYDQSGTTERSRGLLVRGQSTLGNNEPLIVVDGFPVISAGGVDPWSTINPNDVASITVLKDAAAASIWGASAANGVIVIQTKNGRGQVGTSVNASVEFVTQPAPDLYDILFASSSDAIEVYRSMFMETSNFDQLTSPFNRSRYEFPEVIDVFIQMKAGDITEAEGNARLAELAKIDVRDEFADLFYQQEMNKKISVAFTNGNKVNNLRASIMATDSRSYAIGDNDLQILGNLNNRFSPVDWFSFNFGVNFSFTNKEKNGVDIRDLEDIPQMSRILDDNGDYLPMIMQGPDLYYTLSTSRRRELVEQYNLPYDWDWNLKRDIDNKDQKEQINDIRLNAALKITPFKGFAAEVTYQYQNNSGLISNYYSPETWHVRNEVNQFAQPDGSFAVPQGGMLYERRSSFISHNGRFQLTYDNDFKDHSLRALFGMEVQKKYRESIPYGFYGYDPQSLTQISNVNYNFPNGQGIHGRFLRGIDPIPTLGASSIRLQGIDDRFLSYYGNVGYSYKNRYDITGSIRLDQTNLFGRTGSYRELPQWSFGLGYTLSDEPFFNSKSIDYLRFRASYGWNGHIEKSSSPFLTATPWIDPNNNSQYGVVQNSPSHGLTWEKTANYNFGTDFSLFDHRIKGLVEVYYKKSTDVLADFEVNPTYGFYYDEVTVNQGTMKNQGIEAEINALVVDKKTKWQSSLNYGYNKNEVVNVTSSANNLFARLSNAYANPVAGQPVSYLAVAEWAGYSDEGLPMVHYGDEIVDITEIPYTGADLDKLFKFVGQKVPKHSGSWLNRISYKNFELSTRMLYSFGHKFIGEAPPRNGLYGYTNISTFHTWVPEILVNRWQSPADNETASMYSIQNKVNPYTANITNDYIAEYNTRNVMDAGQVRLQSISLAYTLPKNLIGNFLESVKIQVEARNLGPIFLVNDKGVDPSYPKLSTSFYTAFYNVLRDRPEYSLSLRVNL
ncbi:SusC/RagA family TonB-linked outer membrane protein [Flavobacteriaceae bacterium F08102]|nr:SusC/RagA family TonB-linked outer membrane protein [Flavobacteriaceae bacterium F08102]